MKFEDTKKRVETVLYQEKLPRSVLEKEQLINDLIADNELTPQEKLDALNITVKSLEINLGMSILTDDYNENIKKYFTLLIQLLSEGIPTIKIYELLKHEAKHKLHKNVNVFHLLAWYVDDEVIQYSFQLLMTLYRNVSGISITQIFKLMHSQATPQRSFYPAEMKHAGEDHEEKRVALQATTSPKSITTTPAVTPSFFSIAADRNNINFSVIVQLMSEEISKHISFPSLYKIPTQVFDQFLNDPGLVKTLLNLLHLLPSHLHDSNLTLLSSFIYPLAQFQNLQKTSTFTADEYRAWRKGEQSQQLSALYLLIEHFKLKAFLTADDALKLYQKTTTAYYDKIAIDLSSQLLEIKASNRIKFKINYPFFSSDDFTDDEKSWLADSALSGNRKVIPKFFTVLLRVDMAQWQKDIRRGDLVGGIYEGDFQSFDRFLACFKLDYLSPQVKIIFYRNMYYFCYGRLDEQKLPCDDNLHYTRNQIVATFREYEVRLLMHLSKHMPNETYHVFRQINEAFFSKIQQAVLAYLHQANLSGTQELERNIRESRDIMQLSYYLNNYLWGGYSSSFSGAFRRAFNLDKKFEKWLDNTFFALQILLKAQLLAITDDPHAQQQKIIFPDDKIYTPWLIQLGCTSDKHHLKIDSNKIPPAETLAPPDAPPVAAITNPTILSASAAVPPLSPPNNYETSNGAISGLIPLSQAEFEQSMHRENDEFGRIRPDDCAAQLDSGKLHANSNTPSSFIKSEEEIDLLGNSADPVPKNNQDKHFEITEEKLRLISTQPPASAPTTGAPLKTAGPIELTTSAPPTPPIFKVSAKDLVAFGNPIFGDPTLLKPAAAKPASEVTAENGVRKQDNLTSTVAPISDAELALLARQKVANHEPEPKVEERVRKENGEQFDVPTATWNPA